MLKENLRIIFKNRLTWLVLLILLIVVIGYSFAQIFNEYKVFEKYIYDGKYLVTKPYAITAFSRCEDVFGGVVLLTSPICLSFFMYKSDSYDNITSIRGSVLKQRIYKVIAIAIVTTIFFYIAYALGMLTFYFTMNPNMQPEAYYNHLNNEFSGIYNYESNSYLMGDLFWINKGNTSYLYFLVHGLLYSLMMFTFMLVIGSFTFFFKNHMQVFVFIVFAYIFLVGTSYIFDNFLDFVFQPAGLVYMHEEYDGMLLLSWIVQPILYIFISFCIFFSQYIIMNKSEHK